MSRFYALKHVEEKKMVPGAKCVSPRPQYVRQTEMVKNTSKLDLHYSTRHCSQFLYQAFGCPAPKKLCIRFPLILNCSLPVTIRRRQRKVNTERAS